MVRASDDFFPRDPASHTVHIAAVAYNSVFLGEFMLPDWDMFHSLHQAGDYHGSARAISGGPVYVRLVNSFQHWLSVQKSESSALLLCLCLVESDC